MPGDQIKRVMQRCSVCVNGEVLSLHTGLFTTCTSCNGYGTVLVSDRCACGAPITEISEDKHFFCGRKACLLDMRCDDREAEAALERAKYGSHGTYGWYPDGTTRWAE